MVLGSYDVGAFARTRAELDRPDVQLMYAPFSLKLGTQAMALEREPGMQLFGYMLRSESQGSVMIRSKDPNQPARICTHYLTAEIDRRTSVAMVRYIRKLWQQPSLRPYLDEETTPGPAVQSDADIIDAFGRFGQSGYHAAGTYKMGADAMSVVDGQLWVRGVDGLRVMDLSVFPR